jgi:cytochrome c peroxidase
MAGAILCAIVGTTASCGRPAAAADATTKGAHGAAPMSEQLAALADLMPLAPDLSGPAGLDPIVWAALIPEDNALTPERVALGRALYFDTRLSRDGTVSCATCHDTTRFFTDRRPVSEGVDGQLGHRNAPTTMNAALLYSQFLDGRAPDLEAQAKLPIINSIEMAMPDGDAAVAAISGDKEYQRLFAAAYGRPVNFDDIARALAAFERTLIFLDSPLDRFLAGDREAISESAARGWVLFNGKGRCVTCHPLNHANPLGSDGRFHNVGVSARHQNFEALAARALALLAQDPSLERVDELAVASELSELGRFLVSRHYADIGGFRTPQIRNAGVTAPYMHDGSMQTLWDVMDHYNKGGEVNAFLDGGMEPLALTESEIDDVVALMFSLTDVRFAAENQAEFERQRIQAARKRPFRDDDLAFHRRIWRGI